MINGKDAPPQMRSSLSLCNLVGGFYLLALCLSALINSNRYIPITNASESALITPSLWLEGASTTEGGMNRKTIHHRQLRTFDNADTYPVTASCSASSFSLFGEEDIKTTLVVQLSLNRIYKLEEHCKRWKSDPIVAVVSVTQNEFASKQIDGELSQWTTTSYPQLTLVEYVLTDAQEDSYPVNLLRNVGLDHVRTSHVLLVDVDFITSQDLPNTIRDVLTERRELRQQTDNNLNLPSEDREAIAVPAFERRGPCAGQKWCGGCDTEAECRKLQKEDERFVPRNLEELAQCVSDKLCVVFRSYAKKDRGHSTTRSKAWMKKVWYEGSDTTMYPRQMRSIKCFDHEDYEPYVVLRWCPKPESSSTLETKLKPSAPYFDERFYGYGWNKIQHLNHLRFSGYGFSILPEGFLVHSPHATSDARTAFNVKTGDARNNMEALFNEFISALKAKYADRQESSIQICGQKK